MICVVADVGPCLESFDGVPGFIPEDFNEGQLRYGVTTVDGCQSACQADSNCIRFSYITDTSVVNFDSNRVCYLFNSRAPLFVSNPGGRVYFRRKCVPLNMCTGFLTSSKRRQHILSIAKYLESLFQLHLHSVAEFFGIRILRILL